MRKKAIGRAQVSNRKPPGRGSAVLAAEKAAITALAISGVSNSAIARTFGRSRKTVARIRTTEEFRQAKELARSLLMDGAADFAEDWKTASRIAAASGRHDPAKDALLGLRVIDPPTGRQQSEGFTVQIGVMLPGLGPAAQTTTVIDAQPEPNGVTSATTA